MPSSTSSSKPLPLWLRDLVAFCMVLALPVLTAEACLRARFVPSAAQKAAAVAGAAGRGTLVLGPSSALQAIDPRPFGGYNVALPGAGPVYWRRWYDLLRPRCRPARVVLEVPWYWDRHALWRSPEHDAAYLPLAAWLDLLARPETDRGRALANSSVLAMTRASLVPVLMGRHSPAPSFAGWEPWDDVRWRDVAEFGFEETEPAAAGALTALLDALAADKVPVVLVRTPTYRPEAGRKPLRSLAGPRGLPYLDYDDERRGPLNQDRGAFVDAVHMAQGGAVRFSAKLAADLAAAGLIDRQPR